MEDILVLTNKEKIEIIKRYSNKCHICYDTCGDIERCYNRILKLKKLIIDTITESFSGYQGGTVTNPNNVLLKNDCGISVGELAELKEPEIVIQPFEISKEKFEEIIIKIIVDNYKQDGKLRELLK